MNHLLDLQEKFQAYLLHSDNRIYQDIIETKKMPAEVRLSIYGKAYRARLLEALAMSYPVLKSYLGDDRFEELGYAYINAYPSCFRSVRWFGDQLSQFLSEHSDYKSKPYLSELAKVEWTMTLVFDAEDNSVIGLKTMENIDPEDWARIRFQAHPSVNLLNLSWNVVPLWQSISHQQKSIKPKLNDCMMSWIFWRKELTSQFCSLSEDEAYAIDAMLRGLNFGDICEGLGRWVGREEAPMRAASLLKGWITAGIIAGVES